MVKKHTFDYNKTFHFMKKRFLFLSSILIIVLFFIVGFKSIDKKSNTTINLVQTSNWYIAGPAVETEENINLVRLKKGIIKVTAKENPVGEIELNVLITPSNSNDGVPTNLSDASKFVEIIYKSTHLIKIQAREGNENGTGCVHGGSHPRADLPASPKKFTTIKIPWSSFKQDGLSNGKLLNTHNLCKFNFVNYTPVSGASLEIKSVIVQI